MEILERISFRAVSLSSDKPVAFLSGEIKDNQATTSMMIQDNELYEQCKEKVLQDKKYFEDFVQSKAQKGI